MDNLETDSDLDNQNQTINKQPQQSVTDNHLKSDNRILNILIVILGIFTVCVIFGNIITTSIQYPTNTTINNDLLTPTIIPPEISPVPTEIDIETKDVQFTVDEKNNFVIKIDKNYPETGGVEISIIDKLNNKTYPIQEKLRLWGSVIIFNSEDRKYLLLSSGTGVNRDAFLIDLLKNKLITPSFIIVNEPWFVGTKLIFNDMNDSFQNRPWEGGTGTGVAIFDLDKKIKRVLFQSDLLNDYFIKTVETNELLITHYKATDSNWSAWEEETIRHVLEN